MTSNETVHRANKMLDLLEELLVSPDVASLIFGIKRRYFNRLVNQNAYHLRECRFEHPYFVGPMYYREDIERIAAIYRNQKKRTSPDVPRF